jgi:AcrR family transcriptional regulator
VAKKNDGNFGNAESFRSFAADMQVNDTKDRIKVAAHELLLKYGIRTVSMDDIATHLGMSKKTLYQYYRDKDELVLAVVDTVINENECTCKGYQSEANDAIHEMFLVMEMMVEMFSEMNPSVVYDLQKYHPTAYQVFLKHKTEFLQSSITRNILWGIEEGLYRPDLNINVLTCYRLESMFIPFNPDFQRRLPKVTLIEIEEQIILNFLFGLVSAKGYKLAMKYLEHKNKLNKK